ncbi:MAG: hypothetical protein E4H33_02155 [Anaerolineales bacterium]|nr:MAG: hypothetical protein E4H33_02155 [Anaerolineales bacterium]
MESSAPYPIDPKVVIRCNTLFWLFDARGFPTSSPCVRVTSFLIEDGFAAHECRMDVNGADATEPLTSIP